MRPNFQEAFMATMKMEVFLWYLLVFAFLAMQIIASLPNRSRIEKVIPFPFYNKSRAILTYYSGLWENT